MIARHKWYIFTMVLIAIAGFSAGMLTGIFVERRSFSCLPMPPMMHGPHGDFGKRDMPPPDGLRSGYVNMVAEKLSLTDVQIKEFEKILDKNEPKIFALHDEIKDKMFSIQKESLKELSKTLSDEQKKKLDEFIKKDPFEDMMRRGGGPEPPFGGGGHKPFPGNWDREKKVGGQKK